MIGDGDIVLILTTAGSREDADRMAIALVEERLAACVQIEPVRSVYRWQGSVETAEEYRLQVKTRASLGTIVEARIVALHSYDLPEIVVLPIGGSTEYLAWIERETAR